MEEFTLINFQRSRIKIFKAFAGIFNPSSSINAMEISYGCLYKRSTKPVINGSRVVSKENSRKEFEKLLKEGWKKTSNFKNHFKDKSPLSIASRNS